jgi:hypothetical protein
MTTFTGSSCGEDVAPTADESCALAGDVFFGATFLVAGAFFLVAGAFLATAFFAVFLFVAMLDTLVHRLRVMAEVMNWDNVGCGNI